MKKNVFLLLLVVVMVLGSICPAPLYAAETTSQEAMIVEEQSEISGIAETNELAKEIEEEADRDSTGLVEAADPLNGFVEVLLLINNNFASLLSVIVAVISACITLIYVVFTYKQMKATQNATETAIQQLRLNNQPCVIPMITATRGTKCFTKTRRQLLIEIELDNVGDSPAITVFTFSHLELQYINNKKDGSKTVNMEYIPFFKKCIKSGEKIEASVRYETFEINMLLEDLKVALEKNIERLRTDPHRTHYKGTVLVVEVYYRNVVGQWFKNVLRQEICWMSDKNAAPRKTNNINENTIPPSPLLSDTEFELQLVSEAFSSFSIGVVDEKEIQDKLKEYKEYLLC